MFSPLKKGDIIGIYSPSKPASVTAKARYERGKARLEKLGFVIKEGILTGKADFYRSGTPKERAEELNLLLRDSEVKMILPTMGGTNSNSMLPYLDYAAFKENPKILMGLSDVTAILLAMYAKTGIPVFHGPSVASTFGEFPPFVDFTEHYFKQLFMQQLKLPYKMPIPPIWTDDRINWLEKSSEKTQHKNAWITVQDGVAEGRLIGGNINTMCGFIGTPYFPTIKMGDVLLLEDTSKTIEVVEKNFAMLKLHGFFDKASAIILGKHEQYDDLGTGRKPYDVLIEQLEGRQIPIIADVDCSHTHPLHAMPLGLRVYVDASHKEIHFIEHWLS
ncbi:peptidase S66 [Lysinibacillus contaminans]|uniref:Peptidase S66 n=1 Tax=Lysinibacillus contaminans TaxID=1293441 RepID=A0ABR5K0M8_9BACI|nr:S66 peptidase family protein [Lysinibacillus contaminans]KOS68458.1 peptidase S66 [Lysinibacillus contaminans]